MKLIALTTALLLLKLARGLAALGDHLATPAVRILDHYDRGRR
ncbi:hypothetical protein [Rhizobium sp. Leaf386]|nr:hypothetical protein [Rhizobium sp. Leaf386]